MRKDLKVTIVASLVALAIPAVATVQAKAPAKASPKDTHYRNMVCTGTEDVSTDKRHITKLWTVKIDSNKLTMQVNQDTFRIESFQNKPEGHAIYTDAFINGYGLFVYDALITTKGKTYLAQFTLGDAPVAPLAFMQMQCHREPK